MSRFDYPRSKRLLTARDFKTVFDGVVAKAGTPELLLLATPSASSSPRIGFIVGKKAVKLAVDRNRIKRHFREQFRLASNLPNIDIIVMAKKGAGELPPEVLSKQSAKLLRKIAQRVASNQAKS
ncbi:ribonuclease P protein component [Salinibius halmophilus]|uniref:ribonuclease P protein component n=1 Tax=Salinibius halmophilus TaxID=1853216 RepID=UPI000E676190|nr:ribonuclease P protein component [Salinibius halmophilus]